jgi:hypothetical protein
MNFFQEKSKINYLLIEKSIRTLSNYHFIVNVSSNYQLCQCHFLKSTKR